MDLGRERGYRCVIASSGEDGLILATRFSPTAILLDMTLPGMDGMATMSALKDDLETRHIPVHVISGREQLLGTLRAGAIGYLHKPVNLGQLDTAFRRIEELVSRPIRRLVVAEDNTDRSKGIVELLDGADLQITVAEEGEQVLALVRSKRIDCVVIGESLSDMSGIELLQRIRRGDENPDTSVVMVLDGEPTADKLKVLHRYADRVISGVRAVERLLDESALFLHRVVADLPEEKRQVISSLHDSDAVLRGKKILLVDDDMRTLFALTKMLADRGMQVIKARERRAGAPAAGAGAGRGHGADGHHDARAGRLRDHEAHPGTGAVHAAADHRPDRQGDAGRPGALHRRRRQRLPAQAGGQDRAALHDARLALPLGGSDDEGFAGTPAWETTENETIEIELLLEALYCGTATTSAPTPGLHRAPGAPQRLQQGLAHISELITAVLHDAEFFTDLARHFSISRHRDVPRSASFYRALREKVLPPLQTFPFIKVWHAGCATGEEVYSLAILLPEAGLLERTTIFGTDFNDGHHPSAAGHLTLRPNPGDHQRTTRRPAGRRSFARLLRARYDSAVMAPP